MGLFFCYLIQKAQKIDKNPSIWHLLSKCQIDGEDFVNLVFLENMNFTKLVF